jgi:hypothetical protein
MDEYPRYVTEAFGSIYVGGEYREPLEIFASRWGGLDLDVFRRALREGEEDDRVLALLAIGSTMTPEAQSQLLPFLESRVPMERWASALWLGRMHDERALPVLQTMLVEGLGPLWLAWYLDFVHRSDIAYLLGEWGPASVVPWLRQAFQVALEVEQIWPTNQLLYHYQDALTYALGQRGAFGALVGLALPPERLGLPMVYLALGHLQARRRYRDFLIGIILNKGLQEEVATVLEQQFGLSEQERDDCIRQFTDNDYRRWVREDPIPSDDPEFP